MSDELPSVTSDELYNSIREEWDEFDGWAHGEAAINPRTPGHEVAADVVPADTPPHKPIEVRVNGHRYTAHRSRRYPDTILFSG